MDESLQRILAKRQAQADANRAQMPFTASIVDGLTQAGFQPSVKFAEENGRTVGKPLPQGVVPVLARNSDPETSHEAATKAARNAVADRALILDVIRQNGMAGATAKEIAWQLVNMTQVQVSRRMSDLSGIHKGVQTGLAFIVPTGDVRDGCEAWRVKV